jgi:hypothetical protein
MLPAPDLSWRRRWPRDAAADAAPRLENLLQRWLVEARAVAAVLAELEAERDEMQRDVALHRLLGEPRPDLGRRVDELHTECDALATELAHVRLALAGVRAELDRRRNHRRQTNRTSA